MDAEWDGKSRGTVFGFKVFVYFINTFGLRAAYTLLYPVVLYFCFFSRGNSKAIFYYFNRRLAYSKFKSLLSVYKSYYVFGQSIIDKTAIGLGFRQKFTHNFIGEDLLKSLMDKDQGGVLISAHLGNFEIAEYFFQEWDHTSRINLVITDAEHAHIKDYLNKVKKKSNLKFIIIQDDMSHIFKIAAAIQKKELVCITGDRYYNNSKTLSANFLGAQAKFPAGPFQIATRLQTPIIYVYAMKNGTSHYTLYANTAQFNNRDSQGLLENYIEDLEHMIHKYPLQWFNYYKFWNEQKHESA